MPDTCPNTVVSAHTFARRRQAVLDADPQANTDRILAEAEIEAHADEYLAEIEARLGITPVNRAERIAELERFARTFHPVL